MGWGVSALGSCVGVGLGGGSALGGALVRQCLGQPRDLRGRGGEQAGRLVPAGKNVWALDGRTFGGGAVHVARLDAGELVLAELPPANDHGI